MIKMQDVPLKIPAIKIKNIDAEIRDLTYEIIPNKVIIQGVIYKQVLFVGNDNIIHHQSDEMPFSSFVDIPGAVPGMAVQINIDIEKILANLSPDGTTLVQKVILNIFVKVEEDQVIKLVLDDNGPLVELAQFIGEEERQYILENDTVLNQQANKVDEIRAKIIDLETELIADKIIIQGVVHKQIFYVNQDDTAVHQAEEIPFSTFLDFTGVLPGMDVIIKPEIEFIGFDLSEDGNKLLQRIVIRIKGRVTQLIQERIAKGIDFLAKLPVVIGENTIQLMKTNDIILDQAAQKIKNIHAEIIDISTEIIKNKVIVQGIIHKQIFYIGNDNIEYYQEEDIPFNTFLEIPETSPGQIVRVESFIEDIIFNLVNENLLQQKVILEIFVKVEEINQLNVVVDEFGLGVLLPVVIGENSKQILVEQEVPPPPPPPQELIIEFKTIVQRAGVTACQQEILDDIIELDCPAIKVKDITAKIENVEAELVLDDLVVITGIVIKDIAYVCEDNIVRHQNVIIPFVIEITLPEPIGSGELNPLVEIENISFTLLEGGNKLRELVILKACIEVDTPQLIRLVTLISGSEITTTTIQVRAEVLISEEPFITEVQIFPVVTDVSDPLGLLTTIIKETLVLDVIGEGKIPVEVVVFAE